MLSVAEAKAAWPLVPVVGERIPLKRSGTRWVGRCPFHDDHGRPNFVVFPATATWACFACGAQGDVLDFLARWTGQSLTTLLTAAPTSLTSGPRPPVVKVTTPRPDVSRIHHALEAWRDHLDLAQDHARALLQRGFSLSAVTRYRTHQPGPAPAAVAGAPGFFRTRQGSWQATGLRGILVPVRDEEGRLVGAQIRLDHDQHGRYRWLSSGGLPGGVASGSPCHVAPGSGTEVWVTEGPLKADLAADRLGVPVLGLAGVTTWRRALPLLEALRTSTVILAFDQDIRPATQRTVEDQARRLETACRNAGWTVRRATWSAEYKGLDDALAANTRPAIV